MYHLDCILFTRPLSGVESISGSSVYLSIYLFVCLSSLLILFLQTLSSRNIPQSTLITQPLPRLTSGVELCVNLTFFQVGIVSFGRSCEGPIPGAYSRVTEAMQWILNNTGKDQIHDSTCQRIKT